MKRLPLRPADKHPGLYSAGLAFDRQRSFAAANFLAITAVIVVSAIASLAMGFWLPGSSEVGAFASGAFLAAAVALVAHWVSVASGSTGASMGMTAERWTATELQRLRHHGWQHINSVMFRQWDVDHIAVGPNGVIVIETKWRSQPVDLTNLDERLLYAAERLHRNERDVAGYLQWGAKPDAWITSVLVVWGPNITQPDYQPLRSKHGVNVLAGTHLRQNLAELTEQVLDRDEVDQVFRKLELQARKRDQPESTSWRTIQQQTSRSLLVSAVGFVGAYLALMATGLGWWYFAAAALFAVIGAVGVMRQRLRSWAWSWLIGTQVVTVVVAVVVLVKVLTQ